jgi:hypothetical protein
MGNDGVMHHEARPKPAFSYVSLFGLFLVTFLLFGYPEWRWEAIFVFYFFFWLLQCKEGKEGI